MAVSREEALKLVDAERNYQDWKWGEDNPHTLPEWYLILGKQVGQLGEAINAVLYNYDDGDVTKIKKELVEIAAVCVAILEQREERRE
ncbi:MAG: hypothetical protein HF312_17190 [Ignavibacteria bacterium]|jgi:hypothetical protein|nr:hypothetical protein [Ignavibacteria bacterium]